MLDVLAAETRRAQTKTNLDLHGLTVLTEAANGTYACLAALAALSGAEVLLWGRDTRFGTRREAEAAVRDLAERLGVADRLRPARTDRSASDLARADIVTNSGHVRPIDPAAISRMKPTGVVPLMYESWEWRRTDVDVAECIHRGIAVAGTNEGHPLLKTFESLGDLAARGLTSLGRAVRGCRLLLISDNAFGSAMQDNLRRQGAEVELTTDLSHRPAGFDAVVLAFTPESSGGGGGRWSAPSGSSGLQVVQVWGDANRAASPEVAWWPRTPPEPGHMGMLLTELEPGVLVRLLAGGLKVGEMLARLRARGARPDEAVAEAVRAGWALPPPPIPENEAGRS